MNSRNIIKGSAVFVALFFMWAWTLKEVPQQLIVNQLSNHSFDQFENKTYFTKVFTEKEQKTLKDQKKRIVKAEGYLTKYKSYATQIANYKKILNSKVDEKTKKSAQKKVTKLEKKAAKYGIKAMDQYNKLQVQRFTIYDAALKRLRNNNSSTQKETALKLEAKASVLASQSSARMAQANSKSGLDKFNFMKDAFDVRNKLFEVQEAAFGVYMNDPVVTPQIVAGLLNEQSNKTQVKDTTKTNTNPNTTQNKDTTKTDNSKTKTTKADTTNTTNNVVVNIEKNEYNPLKDINLYNSKRDIILSQLKLTETQKKQIEKANEYEKSATKYNKEVDSLYEIIDSLHILATKQTNPVNREKISQKAISEEQWAFARLLVSVRTSLEENTAVYEVYKEQLSELSKVKKGTDAENAKALISDANTLWDVAQKDVEKTKRMMYKSEQYIQLMEANSIELVSLQKMENAFGYFLNIPELKTINRDSPQIAMILSPEETNAEEQTKDIENATDTNKTDNSKTKNKKKTIVTSNYVYSITKPKPQPVVYPKGVIFKVQVGYFKKMLSPKKYPHMMPINGQKFNTTPYQRFFVGEFKTLEAANEAKKTVNKKYKDAFVVAYLNGKRIASSKAKSIAETSPSYKNTIDKELLALQGKTKTVTKKDPVKETTKVEVVTDGKYIGYNITRTKGAFYCVQLGSYSKQVTHAELLNESPIYYEIQKNGHVRYLCGMFNNRPDVDAKRNEIRKKGIKDAFVVAYSDGKHVSLSQAKKLVGKSSSKPETYKGTKPDIDFRIQVGAFSVGMPKATENKLKAIPDGDKIFKEKNKEGLVLYMVGKYDTYSQAQKLLLSVKESGFNGSFIVAYKENKRIEISEALKLLEN